MKTRKTKKRNIIRRTVAFLLCMTMVLGLGMQDVIEQVYAEEAIPVIEQEAATEEAGELTTEGAGPEENAETAEEPDESVEEAEEQPANSTPSQPADAEENTKTDVPSAPAENAGSEEGEKQNPSAPAEDGQSGSDSETSTETNPGGNTGNEITAPAEDENTVTNPDETTGEDTEDDAAVSDEEEETTEPEEDQEYVEEEAQAYDKEETVGNVTIHVYAEAGVLPEDAELSVTPIEKKEITEDMSEEEKAEAEEINAQYEETEQKLKEDVEPETEAAMDDAAVNAVNTISAENAETDETAGKTLEGFLAYDISFLVKDENGEKAEIEPEGEVKVSFEFDEAVIPEGVSEDAEVAVKHLKEDENAEGGIVVEDVTENAEVTINESAAVEAMSLTTDSFSVFVITWEGEGHIEKNITIQVHYVYLDENNDVQNIKKDVISEFPENIELENDQTVILSAYQRDISGFIYQKTVIDDAKNGTEVAQLQAYQKQSADQTVHYVRCLNSDGNFVKDDWVSSSVLPWEPSNEGHIYIVYKESALGLRIVDNLIEYGTFDAVYSSEDGKQPVEYKWYRSKDENGEYVPVEKKNFQGGASNLTENGAGLYPAYDKDEDTHIRYWYKVEAILDDGTAVRSKPYQVPYYDELQNGSFETPGYDRDAMHQVTNEEYKNSDGVWQSTGSGYHHNELVNIEVLYAGDRSAREELQKNYNWENGNVNDEKTWAADGKQFAELNAEGAGALYQDVLTIPGEPLNYALSHRTRGLISGSNEKNPEYDTMFLVIMPTKDSQDLVTQEQLEDKLRELGVDVSIYEERYEAPTEEENLVVCNRPDEGILVVRITSDDQNWHDIEAIGGYKPTESVTRFFFVSGVTEATRQDHYNWETESYDGNTIGNFLDDVWFSQRLPEVKEDEFSITILKDFDGLDQTGIDRVQENIQFVITAKKEGVELSTDAVAELLGRSSNVLSGEDIGATLDGLKATIPNHEIDGVYEITITEQNAELDGYEMSAVSEALVKVGGDETETETGGDRVTFTLQGDTEVNVTFTNTYARSENKTVSFSKVWDDFENTFKTRPESITVTLKATIYKDNGFGELAEEELGADKLGGIDLTRTLTANDGWKTSWDVPAYYEENGTKIKINYTVVENGVDGEYVYEAVTEEAQQGDGSEYTYKNSKDKASTITEAEDTSAIADTETTAAFAANALNAAGYGDSDDESGLGTPAHNKYVEYNRNTGDYTLNLDVTGAQGEASGVDVLFVIDTSGSMAGSWYGGGLLSNVQDLLTEENGIIDQIFEGEGNVNSVAYVSFAGKSETRTSGWYQKSSSGSLKRSINNLYATGGTNWTYAMQRASSLLAQRADSGNEKVVIFLSDGEPTYSMNGSWQTGSGSTTRNEYYQNAADVVKDSLSLSKAKFYSVYLTNGTESGMSKFNTLLDNAGVDAELKNGVDLSTALTDILQTIIPTYESVVITDTLSDYVDFVDKQITVTARSANGYERELGNDEYQADIRGKTITVTLLNGSSLTSGTTYTVSFRIKPNDAANSYFAEHNGYPATGEAGTGGTSANQEGFYSNKENTAKVTYEVNGKEGSADYPMPVVQVTTHVLTFEKIWNHPDNIAHPNGEVKLNVKYTDGSSEEITLTEGDNWKTSITVPVTKSIVSVEEVTELSDYTPSYQISNEGTYAKVINNYSKVEKQDITVTKRWSDEGSHAPIQVVLLQSIDGGEAVIKDTQVLSSENNWTYTWKAETISEYENGTEHKYSYAVREVNTPAGYSSSISYEFKKDAIEATITNTFDQNCADEHYYIANVLQTEELTISKIWDDNDDALGLRPESIGVSVHDGKDGYYNVTLNKSNYWQKTLTILKKANTNFGAQEGPISSYEQRDKYITTDSNGVSVSFVNKITSKDLIVRKDWHDGLADDEITQIRPGSVSFKLLYSANGGETWQQYQGENEAGLFTLTQEDRVYINNEDVEWAKKITGLPGDYQYKVEEVLPDGSPYISEVSEGNDGVITITNTLGWTLKKTDMDDSNVLKGAEFTLMQGDDVIATGTSGDDGFVDWEKSLPENMNGVYILTETVAPDGYQKLQGQWTLTFENGLLEEATGDNGYGIYISKGSDAVNGVVVTLKNDKIYELPETGGPGIHLYMLGGVALMMAGTLLAYKKRKEEVLRS